MRIQHRQTYANRGFRFIHGFYVSVSIHKILKGSLKPKLKVASVWLFNPCSKVYIQSESVIYDHSTSTVMRKLTKVNCSDNEGNFYVPRIGSGLAGPVFMLDQRYMRKPLNLVSISGKTWPHYAASCHGW